MEILIENVSKDEIEYKSDEEPQIAIQKIWNNVYQSKLKKLVFLVNYRIINVFK